MAFKRNWAEVAELLSQRKARFHKWSRSRNAIYYSPTTSRYIMTVKTMQGYNVTEHSTCPCNQ